MVMLQHPLVLCLLVLLIPLAWSANRLVPRLGATRAWLSCAARGLLLVMLTLALAQPLFPRGTDDVTVAVIVDRSRSVSAQGLEAAVQWVNAASHAAPRTETDRLAVIHVAAQAVPGAMPDQESEVSLLISPGRRDATDLNRGIELAKAMLPEDTRNRLLVLSDGLDTVGSLAAAAQSEVPIDVLVLPVDRQRDVRIERIAAPTRARPGTPVQVEVVLNAAVPATGQLVVRHNGVPVRLDGQSGIDLSLAPGVTVVPLRVLAGDGLTRIEATWLPDDRTGDAPENDHGRAVVLPASVGTVLLVGESPLDTVHLAAMLRRDGIGVRTGSPSDLAQGTASLAAIDAVVLVNTPRWAFPPNVDAALRSWVEATGGGLLMTGGARALGAGGWIGSEVEQVLPVQLDPPAQRQLQRGALVLIMHSCEMERGNYWGRRICETAIEALSSLDLVGIVEYANRSGDVAWALPLQEAGDRVEALAAARRLRYGDMPDLEPSMRAALDALEAADAGQRHIVLISDGDPQPPAVATLMRMREQGIAVTTVQVGGHGRVEDRARMEQIAQATGGQFHKVDDPSQLPQIIIEASQLATRTLIQRGEFAIAATGASAGPVLGCPLPPPIEAYVLTAPRADLASTPWVVSSAEGADPLVAWWQRGNGRAAVITVPPSGAWTPDWDNWPDRERLWTDLVRWLRPAPDDGIWALQVREGDGGRVEVSLEATAASAQNVLPAAAAVLLGPDGQTRELHLQPAGPGRAVGHYVMDAPGEWVAVAAVKSPQSGDDGGHTVLRAATAQAWPDEDRARRADAAALHQLAAATGGRVHLLEAPPEASALFSREGLALLTSPAPVWPWLVIAAAILLPIDVAVRRLVLRRDDASAVAVQRRTRSGRAAVATPPSLRSTSTTPRAGEPSSEEPEHREADDAAQDDAMDRLREARRRGRGEEEEL